jgi:Fe-S-cluster containining protein
MVSRNRPLIELMTNEQQRKEKALSHKLSEAESAAVCDMLSQEFTQNILQEVLENASGFAETMTQKLRDPATPEVACKQGCHWCCFQFVGVSAPEAFRIVRFLSTEAMATGRTEIVNRLRELDKATRGKTTKACAKLHLPCAFLADSLCTIYPVRPLACAEFTSFNLQDCKRGYSVGFKPNSIIHEKARMLVYYAIQEGLRGGLRKALPKADTTPLELISAVVSVLNSSDPEVSWIAGGKVFANAHLAIN